VSRDTIRRLEIDPQEFGVAACRSGDLAGGDAAANLASLHDVFAGRDRGAHMAALTLQSGLALFIAARAASPQAGIDMARAALDSGRAQRWLERLQDFAAEGR
jgi:anthranilate phosphoribosyltransferase